VLDGIDAHGQRGLRGVPALEQRAIDAGFGVAGGGHPVVLGCARVPLERPAEDRGIELLRPVRVVHWDLEVRGSRWHAVLLASRVEGRAITLPQTCIRRAATAQ